jgi:hypothetical protein
VRPTHWREWLEKGASPAFPDLAQP